MDKPLYPPDLAEAWNRLFGHAWHKNNKEFLHQLRKAPRQTIGEVVNSGKPESILGSCATILEYVNDDYCEYGFISLPTLPEGLEGLSEEQLYAYANQSELYGIMRHT
jgi:hypothetical protein